MGHDEEFEVLLYEARSCTSALPWGVREALYYSTSKMSLSRTTGQM